jgi:hypothetical protein
MNVKMDNVKKDVAKSMIAAILGLSALGLGAGAGAGIASADPCFQQNCQGDDHHRDGGNDDRGNGRDDHQWGDQWRPDRGGDQWRPDQGWDQRPWDQRGVDDARFDHQPFNWQGQRVEPYWDQGRGAWGFWFFGVWIPL